MTEKLLEVPEIDFDKIIADRKMALKVNVKVRDNDYVKLLLSEIENEQSLEWTLTRHFWGEKNGTVS